MTAQLRKGSFVTYPVRKLTISAVVRTMHRDGSVTVEARHVLDASKPHGISGGYLGYRYRMAREDLTPAECA